MLPASPACFTPARKTSSSVACMDIQAQAMNMQLQALASSVQQQAQAMTLAAAGMGSEAWRAQPAPWLGRAGSGTLCQLWQTAATKALCAARLCPQAHCTLLPPAIRV